MSNLSSMESYIEKLWAVCRCKVDTLKILFQFFHHNSGCLLTIWSYKSYHHHSARQKSVFPGVMRSCLTNGVMLTTFSYLGVYKNGLNLGCHTKLNARENRVLYEAKRVATFFFPVSESDLLWYYPILSKSYSNWMKNI